MADKSLNRDTSRLDDTIWDHKWGFADTRLVVNTDDMTVEMTGSRYNLCGFRMPYLIPFAEEALGLKLDFSEVRPQPATRYVSPVNRNEPFCSAVASAFANDQVSFDDRVRLLHSHGRPPSTRCRRCSLIESNVRWTWSFRRNRMMTA